MNRGKSDVFLISLLAISLALNVFFVVSRPRRPPNAATPPITLAAGDRVPPLRVRQIDGKQITITYSEESRSTVLYAFAPSCPWCRRNANNIRELAAQRSNAFRFIGISLEAGGLSAHLVQNEMGFPVFVEPTQESRSSYHFGGIPQTIVVSQSGEVVKNWHGAYGTNRAEIERFFEVKLPGLSEQAWLHSDGPARVDFEPGAPIQVAATRRNP